MVNVNEIKWIAFEKTCFFKKIERAKMPKVFPEKWLCLDCGFVHGKEGCC